jgi:hypothetical protein
LRQHCHNSKCLIFQEKCLQVLKSYNFVWVQRRQNCSPAASFVNSVMRLYLLKVHLQTFFSVQITQKKNFWVVTLLSQMSEIFSYIISCLTIYTTLSNTTINNYTTYIFVTSRKLYKLHVKRYIAGFIWFSEQTMSSYYHIPTNALIISFII